MNIQFLNRENSILRLFSVYLNLLFLLLALVLVFTQNIENILSIVPDDAFYYFKIAENFTQSGKLTFDGFANTNGFHPLWLLFILPVKYFLKMSPEINVKIILLIQLLLCFVSIKLLICRIKTVYSTATVIVIFSYFLFKIIGNYINGLESSLLFFLYTILFCYSFDKRLGFNESKANYVILGILSGLIVLARLDQIFLVSSFVLYTLFSKDKKGRLIDSVRYTGGFLLLFIPYLLFNIIYFDSMMPISGKLKSTFPHISFSLKLLYDCLNKVTILAILSLIWIVVAKYRNFKFISKPISGIFIIFSMTVLTHFLHTVFFMNWAAFSWHYSFYIFFSLLVFLEPFESILSRFKFKTTIIVAVLLFLIINFLGIKEVYSKMQVNENNNWKVQVYRSAIWAKKNSESQSIFAMSDAGIFSYFSERRVVNLDGLVNNLDFQEVLKDGRLKSYLAERKVKFIVHHSIWDQPDVISGEYQQYAKRYPSRLYEGASDNIVLEKKHEVFRSDTFFDGSYKSVLIIWETEWF
ncbi:MAG: hypothetical protein WC139_13095 [Candidatus Kapaibacterium sp.]